MDMHICAAARLLTAGILCALPAAGQFPQYTAPGSLAVPQTPTRERVEEASEEARWDLGALRVDPRFWLHNMGYNDNVFGAPDGSPQVSDYSATVGAGLVGFSNLGPDLLLSVYVLPEYSWWQDQEQLREEHLNFGAALFGFYNRLTLVLEAQRDEGQRLLSSESLVPFDIRRTQASIEASVDLRGPFGVFGGVTARDFEHSGSAAAQGNFEVATLDREERIARLGLAYQFPSELRVGLGLEVSDTDFPIDPAGRSNTTTGPLVELEYKAEALELAAVAVWRDIDFDGAAARSRSELTGTVRTAWQPGHRLRFDLYGGRSLVYSVVRADRFFTEDRLGLSVGTPWGRRLHVRVYGETGTDDYDLVAGLDPRRDDVTAVGGGLELELSRRLQLAINASQTDYESNQPQLDRSISTLRIGLSVGGDPRPW